MVLSSDNNETNDNLDDSWCSLQSLLLPLWESKLTKVMGVATCGLYIQLLVEKQLQQNKNLQSLCGKWWTEPL